MKQQKMVNSHLLSSTWNKQWPNFNNMCGRCFDIQFHGLHCLLHWSMSHMNTAQECSRYTDLRMISNNTDCNLRLRQVESYLRWYMNFRRSDWVDARLILLSRTVWTTSWKIGRASCRERV